MTKNISLKIASVVTSMVLLASPLAVIAQDYSAQAVYPPATVSITDNAYSPQHLTIPSGTTVTWRNNGTMNHTVTFDNYYQMNSGSMTPGSTFTHTFTQLGTFNYHCQFHSGMTGTITVVSGGGGGGTYPNSLSATVTGSDPGQGHIIVHSITPVRTSGLADGTFQNGWQWIFDVSVPANEPNLAMKFSNWVMTNNTYVMPVANNMRFYSVQSSNAQNQNTAIYITAPDTYSQSMTLTGNLGNAPAGMRRVNITVETRIPSGTPMGNYTTNFGIRTQ